MGSTQVTRGHAGEAEASLSTQKFLAPKNKLTLYLMKEPSSGQHCTACESRFGCDSLEHIPGPADLPSLFACF